MSFLYLDSDFVGPHYRMMCELGYPQLDIKQWDDGEWAILEMLNAPLMPSYTKFHYILKKIRHVEITESNVKRLVRQIDPNYPEFWLREAQKTAAVDNEHAAKEKHSEDLVTRMCAAVTKNPDMMDRIARFGVSELNPDKIALRVAQNYPAEARKLGIHVYDERVPK
jgi:hypothetical protein